MSLATRCTECGTVFRVVPDQLKVSEGWVRCGRCTAVFNAGEHLFDLDAPAAPDESTPTAPEAAAGDPHSPQTTQPGAGSGRPAVGAGSNLAGSTFAEPALERDDAASDVMAEATADGALDAADISIMVDDSPAVRVSIGQSALSDSGRPAHIDTDEPAPTPSFLRSAAPGSFWQRPLLRRVLAAAAVALSAALATQSAVIWRDELAAQLPALRPALEAMCAALGCSITAVRRIDSLSIDASGLSRVEGSALHRLSVTLRNRADSAVLAPAIELTLTDAQGGLLARRVLSMGELGRAAQAIGAGEELPLQALLSTGAARINGYTVELFYP